MIRFLATLATMLFLSSAYFLYCALVVPFTVAPKIPSTDEMMQGVNYQPPVISDTAAKHFSEVAWLNEGGIKSFQSDDTFFFTQHVERDVASGNKVAMSPIAILWIDPENPDAKPYRLLAKKGIIQFENQFFDEAIQLADARPGRVVWGTLEGMVHIDGPDGLGIDGKQIVFSEQSGQLYSDYPVRFRYGPTTNDKTIVKGSADQLNLSLIKSDLPVFGKDMPRVSGASLLTLRRNVDLDVSFVQKGEQHHARLKCDGPFEYDFPQRRASFVNRVRVNHREPDGNRFLTESLDAERLLLLFESNVSGSASPPSGELIDDLKLRQVTALGKTNGLAGRTSQVLVRSEKHDLVATMQELTYDFMTRTASFFDPRGVVAKRADTTFLCPKVTLTHNESNGLERLHCDGKGELKVAHEQFGDSHAEAMWEHEATVFPEQTGPLHIISLARNAQVTIPEVVGQKNPQRFQMGLASQLIQLWVDLDKAQRLQTREGGMPADLPVHRLLATKDVAMVSQDLIIDHSDMVDVHIHKGTGVKETVRQPGSGVVGASFNPGESNGRAKSPFRVSIDQIQVDLEHQSDTGQVVLKHIDGQGHVEIQHQPPQNKTTQELGGNSPVILRGTRVVAKSPSPEDQQITLLGVVDEYGKVTTPAELEFGNTRIKGANITFDQQRNLVGILGAGAFQIPVSTDMDGKSLDQPAILEVVWQERMTFNGLDANFLKAVSCSLKGHQESVSRMTCDDLTVRLNQKLQFTERADRRQKVDVEFIHAKYGVELESNEYQASRLIGARRGSLAEFHINQRTGDFIGLGPGEIHSWSLGDSMKLTPTDSAEANQPIKKDENPGWRHSRLKFSGKFTGNIEQQAAEFEKQDIKILSAPVEQALVKFKEDDVSNVNNAVRLECRSLKIFQREFDNHGYWELFAQNVNDLEGQIFRAVADELSFDERLGRFILRGIGRDATLYFQERPGTPAKPSSHRYIEFIPKKRSLTVDGSSGLSG